MHDDELRLAAGDLLADLESRSGGLDWTYRGRKTWDIIEDVLAAFVAERPADDAEPCGHDHDWLRSAGFRPFYDAQVYDATPCPGRVMVDPDGRLLLSGGVVAERPTRADVRALLRGLKVPAKEGG
jgi:hypothetical protein